MTADERETYRLLLAAGWTRAELNRLVTRSRRPAARARPADSRLARTALDLDILDMKIERARNEQFLETVAALRRLGLDATRLGPPLPERLPGEPTHLARVCAGPAERHDPVGPGRVRRPAGQVLGVR